MKELAHRFSNNPIAELDCVVVHDREEADQWIQLIHRGQQEGAGLVEWSGQVAARYDERKGEKPNFALQILDYIKENGDLSKETIDRIEKGDFPITNLERLLGTPYVRQKLGVDKHKDGKVRILYSPDQITHSLSKVIDDLGTKRITVSKIKSQSQRIEYVNSFSEEELPSSDSKLSSPTILNTTSENPDKTNDDDNDEEGTSPPTKRSKGPKTRKTLIPKSCKLPISQHRIARLYRELQKIKVDEFPNASAVLLRVFIELSVDLFIERLSSDWNEFQSLNSFLGQKFSAVIKYMEENDLMSVDELKPVKKAAQGNSLLAASVKTMHQYVHNRHFSAVGSELKITWDDLQLFMTNVWQVLDEKGE